MYIILEDSRFVYGLCGARQYFATTFDDGGSGVTQSSRTYAKDRGVTHWKEPSGKHIQKRSLSARAVAQQHQLPLDGLFPSAERHCFVVRIEEMRRFKKCSSQVLGTTEPEVEMCAVYVYPSCVYSVGDSNCRKVYRGRKNGSISTT